MFTYLTVALFSFISLFHLYLGLGGRINSDYILPKINGKPFPFHSLAALPVAILLTLSTIAFAHDVGLTGPLMYSILWEKYLWLTGIALVIRGGIGLLVFHALGRVIDPGHFKTWDFRLYSPLCIYLGTHCLIVLQ